VPLPPEEPGAGLQDLAASREPEETYRLKPGDLVQVTVYDHPDLAGRIRVPLQGPAKFPLIGEVALEGRTLEEVAEDIRSRLEKEYVAFAPVSLLLEETKRCSTYVLGRVAHPGAFEFAPNRPLSLLRVAAKAGGFLDDADTDRLRLVRGSGASRRSWTLSLRDIEKGGRIGLDVDLEDGDILVVPPLPKVHVLGSVRRPGEIPLRSGARLTLARVVAQAGGFEEGADRSRIRILRGAEGVPAQVIAVPFEGAEGGRTAEDAAVLPGDTVIVSAAARIYVLGEVTRPGGFTLGEETMTATKAITLAGGFSRRADANGTVVIRQSREGQKVIRVPVKSGMTREGERPLVLQPGDIVYVPESFF
jgi:polysaccharide export outer membrane protein